MNYKRLKVDGFNVLWEGADKGADVPLLCLNNNRDCLTRCGAYITNKEALKVNGKSSPANCKVALCSATGSHNLRLGLLSQEEDYPRYSVNGRHVVDQDGNKVQVKGAAIVDPLILKYHNAHGKFIPLGRELFEKLTELGVRFVRFPISPTEFRNLTSREFFTAIDEALELCEAFDMQAIPCLQGVGFPPTEEYSNPYNATTKIEIFKFWNVFLGRFGKDQRIAFLQLFNEPTFSGKFPPTEESLSADWDLWKEFMESLIRAVRVHSEHPVIVGTLFWSQDGSFAVERPIVDLLEKLIYDWHPYAASQYYKPWLETYDRLMETQAVIAGECGHSLKSIGRIPGVRDRLLEFLPDLKQMYINARNMKPNLVEAHKLWLEAAEYIDNHKEAGAYLRGFEIEWEIAIREWIQKRELGVLAWNASALFNTAIWKNQSFEPTRWGAFAETLLSEVGCIAPDPVLSSEQEVAIEMAQRLPHHKGCKPISQWIKESRA